MATAERQRDEKWRERQRAKGRELYRRQRDKLKARWQQQREERRQQDRQRREAVIAEFEAADTDATLQTLAARQFWTLDEPWLGWPAGLRGIIARSMPPAR